MKASAKNLTVIFKHREKVYRDDARKAENAVHRAFLMGKAGAYKVMAQEAQAVAVRRWPAGTTRRIATRFGRMADESRKDAQRTADIPDKSAFADGAALAYREGARDVLAAAGLLPYAR